MSTSQDLPLEGLLLASILAVNWICVVTCVVIWLRSLLAGGPLQCRCSSAAVLWQNWTRHLRQCFCSAGHSSGDKAKSAIQEKVRLLTGKQRVQRGKSAAAIMLPVCLCGSFALLALSIQTGGVKFSDEASAKMGLHHSPLVLLTMTFVVCLYIRMFDRHVTPWTFDVWHFLVLGRMIWAAVVASDVHHLLAGPYALTAGRYVCAFLFGTPSVTCMLNLVLALANSCKYAALLADLGGDELRMATTIHGAVFEVFGVQVLMWATTWMVSCVVLDWSESMERSKLNAKAATSRESKVTSMQAVLCDAVVDVDEHLTLITPSTQLAHFLLRQPLNSSYAGTSLLAFVDEVDRERVKLQVLSASTGPGTTTSVSTRMMDGNRSMLSVQMYCVAFLDADDCQGYCIGVRELKDVTPDSFGRVDSLDSEAPVGSSILEVSATEVGFDSADAESIGSAVVPLVMDPAEVVACVDCSKNDMPILTASAPMTQLVGPLHSEESSLLAWFSDRDVARIVTRFNDALNAYEAEGSEANAQATLGKFKLRPAHALRAGLQYVATVSVDFSDTLKHVSGDDSAGHCPVVFRFTEIGVKNKSSRRSHKKLANVRLTMLDREAKFSR
eukprot:TRINITY_DN31114_c0_g1_i1.p1 TRINITY_DN31114_c0_g1~~TRINITY_DN31114_c0_g1_i1.p1  ORF type:complete len:613 (-),score=73.69 TRINITY_DN31114_c0_g1_i1:199-2037(-)